MAIESFEQTQETHHTNGVTPMEGIETPSGLESVATGIETPDHINLRKGSSKDSAPRSLYTVLPSRSTKNGISGFMASDHVYDMQPTEVSIDPNELDQLDDESLLRKKISQDTSGESGPASAAKKWNMLQRQQEGLGDMVAQHMASASEGGKSGAAKGKKGGGGGKDEKKGKGGSKDKGKGFKF